MKKRIGLITGCFDIVHIGHLELFRFAKKHCDYLVVGLENDHAVRGSKGDKRPIFNVKIRKSFLSEIRSIDEIFIINKTDDKDFYGKLLIKIHPDCLITNPYYDQFWQVKKQMIETRGGRIVLFKKRIDTSTTKIANLVQGLW